MSRFYLLPFFLVLSSFVHAQEEKLNTEQMLNEAIMLVKEGNYRLAIGNKIDPILQSFELQFKNSTKKIYGARTPEEGLVYLSLNVTGADDQKSTSEIKIENVDSISTPSSSDLIIGESDTAELIGPTWGNSLFLKGSALVSLKEYAEANQVLYKAVELSPFNSGYLAEYAYSFYMLKNYEEGLAWATKAKEMSEFSPKDRIEDDKARALRHMGYGLIELNRLDEAEKMYKEALKLNKKDQIAKNELEYIKQLRQKQGGN